MTSKLFIDPEVCKKEGIEVKELLYLLSLYYNDPIWEENLFESTLSKCLITCWQNPGEKPYRIELTREGYQMIESVILNSTYKDGTKEGDRFVNLAKQLQELYPEGKKEGTNYYWRDSVNVIAKKLKSIVKKYGDCFTDEQAIEATKHYVASFNGNYHFMQLLKYFICKNVVRDGETEEQSQMLSYIENAGQEDKQQLSIDWENELR